MLDPTIWVKSTKHTHTHTNKAFCTVAHSSRGQYCAPKPFRGAASRKMTPCCPHSPQPRLVTPVSQGPAEDPIPLGLPLTPHYLPGPNVNGAPHRGQWGPRNVGKKCHKALWQLKSDPLTSSTGPTGPFHVDIVCPNKSNHALIRFITKVRRSVEYLGPRYLDWRRPKVFFFLIAFIYIHF